MEVTITILTGDRPHLLRRTVASLEKHEPKLVQDARVVAYVNAPDRASENILVDCGWVDRIDVRCSGPRYSIGEAVSRLVAAAEPKKGMWLHLEDDWLCTRPWFEQALAVARTEGKSLGQVRARVWDKRRKPGSASRFNMVSHTPISWTDKKTYLIGNAHYTFNPGLVRAELVPYLFPCRSEEDAARKFKGRVAQLLPGAFRHLGDGESLHTSPKRRKPLHYSSAQVRPKTSASRTPRGVVKVMR